jgi:hypothetical protein
VIALVDEELLRANAGALELAVVDEAIERGAFLVVAATAGGFGLIFLLLLFLLLLLLLV